MKCVTDPALFCDCVPLLRPILLPRPTSTQPMAPAAAHCAIDFGTSNSAIALPGPEGGVRLVELEPGYPTMPSAVFYYAEDHATHLEPERAYGRAAIAAYVDGFDGRLMRSMKSILGSTLVEQSTDIGNGRSVRYLDVIAGYLRHLKTLAEREAGASITRAVLGRPVFFVDDDLPRDKAAQSALEAAARQVGFADVAFQYEPIAAALEFERLSEREQLVLVADIGGGTSDFSLVRVGPARRDRVDRKQDILANHGVHIAGTDFDRRIELLRILPCCGFGGVGPPPQRREVPSRVYFDLATWHLINTVYAPQRVAELRSMRSFYASVAQHARLMRILDQRLGHALAALAEAAKIAVAEQGATSIDLALIEPGLAVALDEREAVRALDEELQRIVRAAAETLRLAAVAPGAVQALFFTGGSTGLRPLVQRIGATFPAARVAQGDRFASVVQGLGLHARRLFGAA
jgi:hypothetical chaperone protein